METNGTNLRNLQRTLTSVDDKTALNSEAMEQRNWNCNIFRPELWCSDSDVASNDTASATKVFIIIELLFCLGIFTFMTGNLIKVTAFWEKLASFFSTIMLKFSFFFTLDTFKIFFIYNKNLSNLNPFPQHFLSWTNSPPENSNKTYHHHSPTID